MTEWLKEHLLTCPSRYFLHFDCPGCGLQRSIVALLNGNIAESLRLYPATCTLLMLFIFTALHLKFNYRHGAVIIRTLFIFNACIIVTFYLYKVFTFKIF